MVWTMDGRLWSGSPSLQRKVIEAHRLFLEWGEEDNEKNGATCLL